METTRRTVLRGTVVKRSSANTVRVSIGYTKVHPIYKKRYSRTRFYLVHDAADTAQVGDQVSITPCRPISRLKSWQIVPQD